MLKGPRRTSSRLLAERACCIQGIAGPVPVREEHRDSRIAKASAGEGDDPRRRGVQPLDVVDGDEHGPVERERTQEREKRARQRDGVALSLPGRFEPDRNRER